MRESHLTGCFFEIRGALLAFQAMGIRRTVFIDCTHNKNLYGMLLFIISCIRWSSNTKVSAFRSFPCIVLLKVVVVKMTSKLSDFKDNMTVSQTLKLI